MNEVNYISLKKNEIEIKHLGFDSKVKILC